jgi:hypothetical protein
VRHPETTAGRKSRCCLTRRSLARDRRISTADLNEGYSRRHPLLRVSAAVPQTLSAEDPWSI